MTQNRPNVILITADHLRYDVLGCNGDPVIQTPHIDRLAGRSVSLSNYFVQNPVCQPSRASIMTGRYPRHNGVKWNGCALNENEITMPQVFKEAGYRTACIGKHHVSQRTFKESFDHMVANHIRRGWTERPDGDYTVTNPNEFEQYVRDRGYEYKTGYALPDFRAKLGAVPSDLPDDCHIDAYVGMKTCEWLDGVGTGEPFFLWTGFYGPHHPYVPSGRFAHMYDPADVPAFHRSGADLSKKPVEYRLYCQEHNHKYRGFAQASDETFRKMKAAYYGMVSQLDWQVGEILDALERRGLADNTVIVLTSDHGEFLGDHGIPAKAPFLLDCMLHVPCFVAAPGVAGGRVDDALAESVDLLPTMTRLAGVEAPDCVQGRDLTPLLTGVGGQGVREAAQAEAVDKKCIRTREWKLIHYPSQAHGELYDIANDPRELSNLYASRPDLVEEMTQRLYRLLDGTEDFMHPKYQRFEGVDPATGKKVTHYHTW